MSASQQVSFPPVPLPVISVGRDKNLLSARERMMAAQGLTVRSLIPEEAEKLAREGRSRLWVFCGSVEPQTLVFLACSIRRHSPESRLLLVERTSPVGIEASLFHRVLGRGASPTLVARIVQDLAFDSAEFPN